MDWFDWLFAPASPHENIKRAVAAAINNPIKLQMLSYSPANCSAMCTPEVLAVAVAEGGDVGYCIARNISRTYSVSGFANIQDVALRGAASGHYGLMLNLVLDGMYVPEFVPAALQGVNDAETKAVTLEILMVLSETHKQKLLQFPTVVDVLLGIAEQFGPATHMAQQTLSNLASV